MNKTAMKALVVSKVSEVEGKRPFRVRDLGITHIKETDIIKVLDSLTKDIERRFAAVCPECFKDVHFYKEIPTQAITHVCPCRRKFELKLTDMELMFAKTAK